MAQVFDRAMADPDATRVVLSSEDDAQRAVAVLEPGGLGVISLRDLPDLGPDRTYQLWGVIDDEVISLGVLGHRPGVEPFTVDGDLTRPRGHGRGGRRRDLVAATRAAHRRRRLTSGPANLSGR